jgi:adenylate cyclase
MAGAAIEAREIDLIGVVGRDEPIRIYELAALAGWLGEDRRALFDIYASGLARYRAGDWDAADRAFRGALALAPADGPSTTMLQRIAELRKAPPAAWDGTWRLTSK